MNIASYEDWLKAQYKVSGKNASVSLAGKFYKENSINYLFDDKIAAAVFCNKFMPQTATHAANAKHFPIFMDSRTGKWAVLATSEILQKVHKAYQEECKPGLPYDIEMQIELEQQAVPKQQTVFEQPKQNIKPQPGPVDRLFKAIKDGKSEEVEKLIQEHNGLINQCSQDEFRSPPLVTAITMANTKQGAEREPYLKIIGCLLKQPNIQLNLVDSKGNTALHKACFYAKQPKEGAVGDQVFAQITRQLIARGADVFVKNKNDEYPLKFKSKTYTKEELEQAVKKADITTLKQICFSTPELVNQYPAILVDITRYAALAENTEVSTKYQAMAKFLLQAGAKMNIELDVNGADENGNTALHWAHYTGFEQLQKNLVANGADINSRNKAGQTPKEFINIDKYVPLLFERIERGKITEADKVWLSQNLDREVNGKPLVHLLLEKMQYKDDEASVHHAKNNFIPYRYYRVLLELVPDLATKAVDKNGDTLLHKVLSFKGDNNLNLSFITSFAGQLLEKGARLDAVNNAQQTPLDLAEQKAQENNKYKSIVDYIKALNPQPVETNVNATQDLKGLLFAYLREPNKENSDKLRAHIGEETLDIWDICKKHGISITSRSDDAANDTILTALAKGLGVKEPYQPRAYEYTLKAIQQDINTLNLLNDSNKAGETYNSLTQNRQNLHHLAVNFCDELDQKFAPQPAPQEPPILPAALPSQPEPKPEPEPNNTYNAISKVINSHEHKTENVNSETKELLFNYLRDPNEDNFNFLAGNLYQNLNPKQEIGVHNLWSICAQQGITINLRSDDDKKDTILTALAKGINNQQKIHQPKSFEFIFLDSIVKAVNNPDLLNEKNNANETFNTLIKDKHNLNPIGENICEKLAQKFPSKSVSQETPKPDPEPNLETKLKSQINEKDLLFTPKEVEDKQNIIQGMINKLDNEKSKSTFFKYRKECKIEFLNNLKAELPNLTKTNFDVQINDLVKNVDAKAAKKTGVNRSVVLAGVVSRTYDFVEKLKEEARKKNNQNEDVSVSNSFKH